MDWPAINASKSMMRKLRAPLSIRELSKISSFDDPTFRWNVLGVQNDCISRTCDSIRSDTIKVGRLLRKVSNLLSDLRYRKGPGRTRFFQQRLEKGI